MRDCPTLYHVAEAGSWPSIARHGLLSTTALLDLHGVTGERRAAIEARRPDAMLLDAPGLGPALIRDQAPMDDASLRRCLTDGWTPADWYRLLNGKVFFWLTRSRLQRLLGARLNRNRAHDVLEVNAAALVAAHRAQITLSPINSGATRPFAVARGPATFASIEAYDYAGWRTRRPRGERVVELAVEGGAPGIAGLVTQVVRVQGGGLNVGGR